MKNKNNKILIIAGIIVVIALIIFFNHNALSIGVSLTNTSCNMSITHGLLTQIKSC